MQPVQTTRVAPTSAHETQPAETPVVDGSLLPCVSAGSSIDDSMMIVYSLMASAQESDLSSGKAGVQANKTGRDKALADQKAAIQKEQDNASDHGSGIFSSVSKLVKDVASDAVELRASKLVSDTTTDIKAAYDSPKFWSQIEFGAKAVALAASGVATVATAGAAGPIAVGVAIALSAGGFAVSQTKCLDGILGKNASQYVGLGMEIGAAGVSCGAAIWGTAGTKVAATTAVLTSATGGAADVVAGTANIETARFAANVVDAQADDAQATHDAASRERMSNWILDGLSAAQQAESSTLATISGAIQQHDAAISIAASLTTQG